MENNRIYVKCTILNKETILEIQKHILEKIPIFRPKAKKDLHLTIFHYGKPKDIQKEILDENPQLNTQTFIKNLNTLIQKSKTIVEKINTTDNFPIQQTIIKSDIFKDNKKTVLVLILKKSTTIDLIRKNLLKELKTFLKECGIEDTNTFMSRSNNLKFQIKYTPHITIGDIDTKITKLPEYITKDIQVIINKISLID